MTTTTPATPALPAPRTQQVLQLPTQPVAAARPRGAHALPRDVLLNDDAWLYAEGVAGFAGPFAWRLPEHHGRRCACGCRPAPVASAVA